MAFIFSLLILPLSSPIKVFTSLTSSKGSELLFTNSFLLFSLSTFLFFWFFCSLSLVALLFSKLLLLLFNKILLPSKLFSNGFFFSVSNELGSKISWDTSLIFDSFSSLLFPKFVLAHSFFWLSFFCSKLGLFCSLIFCTFWIFSVFTNFVSNEVLKLSASSKLFLMFKLLLLLLLYLLISLFILLLILLLFESGTNWIFWANLLLLLSNWLLIGKLLLKLLKLLLLFMLLLTFLLLLFWLSLFSARLLKLLSWKFCGWLTFWICWMLLLLFLCKFGPYCSWGFVPWKLLLFWGWIG